jgi:hypothetical protein
VAFVIGLRVSGTGPLRKGMRARSKAFTYVVITGLVPVIPMLRGAALKRIGMAGTDPRIKSGGGHDDVDVCRSLQTKSP